MEVPEDAYELQSMLNHGHPTIVETIVENEGRALATYKQAYTGEGQVTIVNRIFLNYFNALRNSPSQQLKDTIVQSQERLCKFCQEPLESAYEFHHTVPFAAGGTDADLVAVCLPCHDTESELQRMAGLSRENPLGSIFNQDMLELFQMAPKPFPSNLGQRRQRATQNLHMARVATT